mgnify:CR=1 FL=1
MAGNSAAVKVKIDNVVKKFNGRGGEMIAMKGSSVAEELERDAALIRKAGGGRASISTVGDAHLAEPTTIIRVPRVH